MIRSKVYIAYSRTHGFFKFKLKTLVDGKCYKVQYPQERNDRLGHRFLDDVLNLEDNDANYHYNGGNVIARSADDNPGYLLVLDWCNYRWSKLTVIMRYEEYEN